MKNKKMLLIAGVLAAFLMLAVPFAVASADSEDAYGAEGDQSEDALVDIWSPFEGEKDDVTITISEDTELTRSVNISAGVRTLIIEEGVTLTAGENVTDMFIVEDKGVTFNIQNNGKIIGKIDNGKTSSIVWVKSTKDETRLVTSLSVNGGYYSDARPFIVHSAVEATFENVEIDCSNAAVWFGSHGVERATFNHVNIESDFHGLYIGSVKSATLEDVTVVSKRTALEIKSGDVKINDSSFTSSEFTVSDLSIYDNGMGNPISTVFINNKYLNAAGSECTNVEIGDDVSIINKASGNDVKPVIVASGTGDGFVSLNWDSHDSDIYAYYVPKVEKVSNIIVNGFVLVDDADKLTKALEAGVEKIGLMNDIELSGSPKVDQAFTINYGVEINGFGHSIETNGYEVIFDISVYNDTVSFINLTAECMNGIQYPRVINVSESTDAKIVVEGCHFEAGHYAINVRGSQTNTGITGINIVNSTIVGYAALNIWSDSEISIEGSIIRGVNNYPRYDADNKPLFNDFAAITIYGEKSGVENSTVNLTIEDSKLEARAAQDAYEFVIDYRDGTGGLLKLKDVSIIGYGKSYSMYLGDADVEFNGTVTIVDDSAEELYLGGNTHLNGIIVDEGKGSITANVTGNGYVTGSNVDAWASTGAQELDSDSATVGPGQSVTDINSSSNTVIIQTTTQQPGLTLELNDSLTVNVQDNGKEMSVELPAGSQISDNALVHMSQVGYSADGNKQFEITLSGIDNAGMDIYITIPRENNGLDAKVFWIKDDGSRVLMDNLSDDRSSVTFITTHNSLYELVYVSSGGSAPGFTPGMGTVTDEASEGFSTADYATMAGIVIAVVMLIGLVCIVRRN